MLQQTRVEAVKGYYARFLSELPDIAALAACEENRLTKLWEGLGYYSRVRNLQKAARVIMTQHGGEFPRDYAAIRALPGVGDYTAGAVASICFDAPEPAVDGNVLRVLSRVTQDEAPVTRPAVKKAYEAALRPAYEKNPGKRSELTQSLMELGACVCVPNGAPKCAACPLREICCAGESGAWSRLPVKEAKKPRRVEEKTVFFLQCGGQYAVRRRLETGLLAGLSETSECGRNAERAAGACAARQLGPRPGGAGRARANGRTSLRTSSGICAAMTSASRPRSAASHGSAANASGRTSRFPAPSASSGSRRNRAEPSDTGYHQRPLPCVSSRYKPKI